MIANFLFDKSMVTLENFQFFKWHICWKNKSKVTELILIFSYFNFKMNDR